MYIYKIRIPIHRSVFPQQTAAPRSVSLPCLQTVLYGPRTWGCCTGSTLRAMPGQGCSRTAPGGRSLDTREKRLLTKRKGFKNRLRAAPAQDWFGS